MRVCVCVNRRGDLRNGMGSNFVTIRIQVLDLTVICPFVRDIEGGRNRATVRVDSALFKQVVVQPLIQIVHRVVESEQNDLWYLFHRQVACWLVGIA